MITTEAPSIIDDSFQAVTNTETNEKVEKPQRVNKSKPTPKKNVIYLFIIAVIVISSIYWTHHVLSQKQNSAQNQQSVLARINQIETEKSLLTEKLNAINANDISEQTRLAENTVFKGYIDIADWIYKLSEIGDQNGLSVEYQLFDLKEDDALIDVSVVPIEMRVLVKKNTTSGSNFQQFLDFIQLVINDQKYKRLVAAGIENQGQQSALLSFKIEVRKKKDDLLASNLD